MRNATRRQILAGTSVLIPAAMLAACASTPMTPAQIVTQAAAAASGLAGMVKQLSAAYPTLIPAATLAQIETYLGMAQTAATNLAPNLPAATGASTVHVIEGYLNAVLTMLAGPPINGLIPAPFNMALSAVSVILPQLEAFAAVYIPAAAASPAVDRARASFAAAAPVSPNDAVAVLQSFAR